MSWLTHHWLGLTGTGLVLLTLGLLAFFNLPAFLKLVSSVAGAAMDSIRWALTHRMAALALVLAGIATYGLLESYRYGQRIIVIQADASRAADKCASDLAAKDASLTAYQQQERDYIKATKANDAALKAAQQQSAAALAKAAQLQALADRSNADWLNAYSQRPATCDAAQAALATACSGVKDY